jgi:hypothetical protein
MRARLGFLPVAALLAGLLLPAPTLAIGTLDQSQTNVTGHCAWSETYPAGQIFVAGQTGSLDTISLFPWEDLSTRGITIEIHAVSGGAPSTLLASQAWTTSTNGVFVDLTFTTPAQVTSGTAYAIVAVPAGSGFLNFGCSTNNDYAAGIEVYYIGGVGWDGSSVVDWAFRTYVTPVYQAPLQMGYWKKNAAATTAHLPQSLGAYSVANFATL